MIPYHEELESVFRELFDDDSIVLRPEMTASDFENWDSSRQVELMVALEARFKIRFATADILKLMKEGSNVGTMLDILRARLGDPVKVGHPHPMAGGA
jgi:acyl carrier protein